MIVNLLSPKSRQYWLIFLDSAHMCMLWMKLSQILNGPLHLVHLEHGVLHVSISVRCPTYAVSCLGSNSSHLTWGIWIWCLDTIGSLSISGKQWTSPDSFLNCSVKVLLSSGTIRNLTSYHLEQMFGWNVENLDCLCVHHQRQVCLYSSSGYFL